MPKIKRKDRLEKKMVTDEDIGSDDAASVCSMNSNASEPLTEAPTEGDLNEGDLSSTEVYEEKICSVIEAIAEKNIKTRIEGLKNLKSGLSKKYAFEFISERSMTICDSLDKCVRKGRGEEQRLASHCQALLLVQLATATSTTLDLFSKVIFPSFKMVVNDESIPLDARCACLESLGLCGFLALSDQLELRDLAQIIKDISTSRHPPLSLQISALKAWTLIFTLFTPEYVLAIAPDQLDTLSSHLESSSTELRIAAGEAIAVVFESAVHADDDFQYKRIDELCETLLQLTKESNKYRGKKEKKQQKASFREVHKLLEEGDFKEIQVIISTHEQFSLLSWMQYFLYEYLCNILRSGMNIHLKENPVVREMFNLGEVLEETLGKNRAAKVDKMLTTTPKPTLKRKSFSVEEKLNAIDAIKLTSKALVSKKLCIRESTIRGWMVQEEKLRASLGRVEDETGLKVRRVKKAQNSKLDDALYDWLIEARGVGMVVTSHVLKEQATVLHKLINGDEGGGTDQERGRNGHGRSRSRGSGRGFQVTNGWLDCFKRRHGLLQGFGDQRRARQVGFLEPATIDEINQWTDQQSINQLINQSDNQSIDQSANQLTNQLIDQSNNRSTNQSFNQLSSNSQFFYALPDNQPSNNDLLQLQNKLSNITSNHHTSPHQTTNHHTTPHHTTISNTTIVTPPFHLPGKIPTHLNLTKLENSDPTSNDTPSFNHHQNSIQNNSNQQLHISPNPPSIPTPLPPVSSVVRCLEESVRWLEGYNVGPGMVHQLHNILAFARNVEALEQTGALVEGDVGVKEEVENCGGGGVGSGVGGGFGSGGGGESGGGGGGIKSEVLK